MVFTITYYGYNIWYDKKQKTFKSSWKEFYLLHRVIKNSLNWLGLGSCSFGTHWIQRQGQPDRSVRSCHALTGEERAVFAGNVNNKIWAIMSLPGILLCKYHNFNSCYWQQAHVKYSRPDSFITDMIGLNKYIIDSSVERAYIEPKKLPDCISSSEKGLVLSLCNKPWTVFLVLHILIVWKAGTEAAGVEDYHGRWRAHVLFVLPPPASHLYWRGLTESTSLDLSQDWVTGEYSAMNLSTPHNKNALIWASKVRSGTSSFLAMRFGHYAFIYNIPYLWMYQVFFSSSFIEI